MDWIVVIIVGAIIGWLASIIMGTDWEQGAFANIAIGIVGSLLGKWIFADILGIGGAYSAGGFSLIGIFWGVIGAIVLIFILKALRILR